MCSEEGNEKALKLRLHGLREELKRHTISSSTEREKEKRHKHRRSKEGSEGGKGEEDRHKRHGKRKKRYELTL